MNTYLYVLSIGGNKAEEENQNKCVLLCPQKWEENKGHCYLWSKTKQNWTIAEQMCIKNKGHLASITNQDIHNYIWNKLQTATVSSVWVGGTDKDKEGIWKWSDGSVWDFTKWPKEPNNYNNQDCLVILKNNTSTHNGWHDTWCHAHHRFVCNRPICGHQETSKTYDYEVPIPAVASGVVLSIIALALVIFVSRKCFQKKEDDMDADENHVYGIYQFGETDERMYSTNVAVDTNFDYE